MSQKRIHDYRGPRSSEDLNRRFISILPSGVYAGFEVGVDGTIQPGVLLTEDGVRIEETDELLPRYGTSWENEGVPPNGGPGERKDLIVCQYQYAQTIPAPEAHFRVIQGTPDSGEYPALPDHSVLIAQATIQNGGTEWSEVINAKVPSTSELAGAGRTTETIKGNADALASHQGATQGAHGAGAIALADENNRFTSETVEGGMAELAGAGRTNQTVKANADAISGLSSNKEDKVGSSDYQICRNIPAAAAIPDGLGGTSGWVFTADSSGNHYWESQAVAAPVLVVPIVTGRASNSYETGDWFDIFFANMSANGSVSRTAIVRLWKRSVSDGSATKIGTDLTCDISGSSWAYFFKDLSSLALTDRCIHNGFDYFFTIHVSSTDKDKVRFHSMPLYMVTRRAKH